MRLSPSRRAHSLSKLAKVSRIEGGSFSRCGSRLSAARIRFKHLQEFCGFSWSAYQKLCFGA
eukprot:6000129-Pyramimonas_sp.AAC.1